MIRLSSITKKVITTVFLICMLAGLSCNRTPDHGVTGMMVDLLTNPSEAVITNPNPRFSWIPDDNRQGGKQTAWQIMVASNPGNLENNKGDKWSSGKTLSDRSVNISYKGKPLQPNSRYWWKVRVWDHEDKAGRWSEIQQFNTGEFNPDGLKWPGESRWVTLETSDGYEYGFEDRQAIRYHEVRPVSVEVNNAGNHFITFEKAAFGTLKIRVDSGRVSEGDTLVIHLGEKTLNGGVDRQPGGSICYDRVTIALEPGRAEYMTELPRQYSNYPNSQVLADHMPEVTSFRYAEIEGYNGELTTGMVSQHALIYRFDDNASGFRSSSDNLNLIWDLCKHTLKVTPFLGLYIDGTRERMPYEADAYIQQISHYCVDREFAIQRYTNAFLIYNPSWPSEWHLHIVLMAWADYMATGDPEFLERYYDELKSKTLITLAREDGLISTRTGLVTEEFLKSIHFDGTGFRDIVDWPQGTPANEEPRPGWFGSVRIEGETDRFVFSDINTVVNAFHYRNLVLMSKIADVLDKRDDSEFYTKRAELVKSSINNKLLDRSTGLYTDGEGVTHSSLHANMFPVAFGLAPRENYPQLKEFFISKGMACSPYGAPYLFDALYEIGADDYALKLLTSEGSRSWMNMINFGSTITTEAWDIRYKNNMTWNHAWGASPAYIITRKIFGIEPLEPAFRRFLIAPSPGELTHAEIKSPTRMGDIMVRFTRDTVKTGSQPISLEVVVPPNTVATMLLPWYHEGEFTLTVNGKETTAVRKNGRIKLDNLQAGRYSVELR